MKKIFLAFFAALAVHATRAADSLTHHKYPQAVLVELPSEQNRMNALIKDKRYKELAEVKKDALGENKAMFNDFRDNFDFCPVYYFMDTNEHFIREKKFDGVLIDTGHNIAKHIVINAASKDYVIVYYGYPTEQPLHQKVVKDSAAYISNSGEPIGRGLIIDNDKLEQISYLYKLGYDGIFLNRKEKKYAYSSRHFNIEYFPSADDFNNKLKRRKNTHRIKVPRRLRATTAGE